jgi:V/A-type H+-transporting ATPase subunit C
MNNTKIKDTDYLFLSTFIRAREAKMLTIDRMDHLISAELFDDAARNLTEFGYPDMSGYTSSAVCSALESYRSKVFEELTQLLPQKEIVRIFCAKYDYHNIKVIVKGGFDNSEINHMLSKAGNVSAAQLLDAFTTGDFHFIPKALANAAVSASGILTQTGNPQLADIAVDRAYFADILDMAEQTGNQFLISYVRILIDGANLRTAVRSIRNGMEPAFLLSALISGGTVSPESIIKNVSSGDALADCFAVSTLADAAVSGAKATSGGLLSEFELKCDNAVTDYITRAKRVSFGPEPVVAYLHAFENELTAVRMILTGKLAGIAPDVIRGRLRDIYV